MIGLTFYKKNLCFREILFLWKCEGFEEWINSDELMKVSMKCEIIDYWSNILKISEFSLRSSFFAKILRICEK